MVMKEKAKSEKNTQVNGVDLLIGFWQSMHTGNANFVASSVSIFGLTKYLRITRRVICLLSPNSVKGVVIRGKKKL